MVTINPQGRLCTNCGIGTYQATTIHSQSYRCDNCGHLSYVREVPDGFPTEPLVSPAVAPKGRNISIPVTIFWRYADRLRDSINNHPDLVLYYFYDDKEALCFSVAWYDLTDMKLYVNNESYASMLKAGSNGLTQMYKDNIETKS